MNNNGWKCTCPKEAGLDICDKCRERVEAPGYEDIYIDYFKEKARKVAEAEKHFGHIAGCERLMSCAIDETEFDTVNKALQAGEIPPITDSRTLRLGASSMSLRRENNKTPKRVIIDIDPACPYVLVRVIVNENSPDTLQDNPAGVFGGIDMERKPRNITLTAEEAIPISKEIIENFYNNADFDMVYNELERFMKIVELVSGEKPDTINADRIISYLTYASIYAANTRPRSNELDGNN
ncbi:MAG: hypothetical protein LBR85_05140 [Oscillospiraceae bacterium]|jgi:hypothetical protein|nr:hypothetical protein [Oscillospiraceae bacterium]